MLEILLAAAVIAGMYKIADADDQKPWLWAGVTLLLCIVSILFVPLPFLRLLIAGVVAFVLMIGYKVVTKQ